MVPTTDKNSCPQTTGDCSSSPVDDDVCTTGQERCKQECTCNQPYQSCSNNKWYDIPIASNGYP